MNLFSARIHFTNFLIFGLAIFLVFACKSNAQKSNAEQSIIQGLASPITVGVDWTEFFLSDYTDSSPSDITITSPDFIAVDWAAGNEEVELRMTDAGAGVSYLTLESSNGAAQIPLFRTSKKNISFSFDPNGKSYETVQLVGDINAWNPANTPLEKDEDGMWKVNLNLNPGTYGYQLVLDGEWQLDADNPEQLNNGQGGFNSKLTVAAPNPETEPLIESIAVDGEAVVVEMDEANSLLVVWNNQVVDYERTGKEITIMIPREATKIERSYLRLFPHNLVYGRGNDQLLPLDYGNVIQSTDKLNRMDKHQLIMYFLMVDRFVNGKAANDRPTDDPAILPQANHLGGDLKGVINKVNDGYFDEIGMNTIWLSPIPKNPEGAFGFWNKGGVTSKFSSYHGYWPISFTKIDDRFGTEAELKDLVSICHQEDMNLLLDFVANHVHELHPVYQAKKDEDWATDLYLPDGTLNTEKWDEHRLTTWFDVFLPSLNLEREEVTEMLADSAIYWLENYGIDGFRHDATKHIPLNFWRTLTKKVKKVAAEENRPIYQVGETYGTAELIASYINTGMLDGQFDFNVFDAALAGICLEGAGFDRLGERLEQSIAYYGTNHLMGNMSGNQDKPRLMSMATGEVRFDEDAKLAGWTRDINKQTPAGFKKVAMMHAINFFIPGIPCIYYGDEIGMPGGK